jgi:hypothetical protein
MWKMEIAASYGDFNGTQQKLRYTQTRVLLNFPVRHKLNKSIKFVVLMC